MRQTCQLGEAQKATTTTTKPIKANKQIQQRDIPGKHVVSLVTISVVPGSLAVLQMYETWRSNQMARQ